MKEYCEECDLEFAENDVLDICPICGNELTEREQKPIRRRLLINSPVRGIPPIER